MRPYATSACGLMQLYAGICGAAAEESNDNAGNYAHIFKSIHDDSASLLSKSSIFENCTIICAWGKPTNAY